MFYEILFYIIVPVGMESFQSDDDTITTIDLIIMTSMIMIVISLSLYNDRKWSTASWCACTGLRTR